MVAPVSNSRAQHDGFAVLVVILLIVAACVAGYWYARQTLDSPAKAGLHVDGSG
jgi:hypothetical protein